MARWWQPAALILLLATMAATRLGLEPETEETARLRNPAWLPNGTQLRTASLGQRLLLADAYWLELVQYVGETAMAKASRWEALYPLADIVTDLDPRYGYAYQIAGSNLSGLAHRYDEADRILEKGMRNVPDRWSLPFVYGVNKFLYEKQYDVAAVYIRKAAEVGHKPHLALLAANLSLLADDDSEYQVAETFLRESIAQTDQPELMDQLQQRLIKVQTYALLSRLEHAIAAFQKQQGHLPSSLSELALGSPLPQPLRDPAGGEIVYDPKTGEVRSSVLGPRRPLRVEPK
jgi:tetratricopeptide (TPR) repeat protein